jgi:hypothetical protein
MNISQNSLVSIFAKPKVLEPDAFALDSRYMFAVLADCDGWLARLCKNGSETRELEPVEFFRINLFIDRNARNICHIIYC